MNLKFHLSINNNYHVPIGPETYSQISTYQISGLDRLPYFVHVFMKISFCIKISIFDFCLQGRHWVSECAEKREIYGSRAFHRKKCSTKYSFYEKHRFFYEIHVLSKTQFVLSNTRFVLWSTQFVLSNTQFVLWKTQFDLELISWN